MPSGGAIAWLLTLSAVSESPSVGSVGSVGMLPSLLPAGGGSGAVPVLAVGASGMGDGLVPVPEKIAKKILGMEFVEMRDLLPDSWRVEEEQGKNVLTLPKRKSAPLTVLQWVQCYGRMVGVLATKYPGMISELMAYMIIIVKCARDFEGTAWSQ